LNAAIISWPWCVDVSDGRGQIGQLLFAIFSLRVQIICPLMRPPAPALRPLRALHAPPPAPRKRNGHARLPQAGQHRERRSARECTRVRALQRG
jgi:hypothetical protein